MNCVERNEREGGGVEDKKAAIFVHVNCNNMTTPNITYMIHITSRTTNSHIYYWCNV